MVDVQEDFTEVVGPIFSVPLAVLLIVMSTATNGCVDKGQAQEDVLRSLLTARQLKESASAFKIRLELYEMERVQITIWLDTTVWIGSARLCGVLEWAHHHSRRIGAGRVLSESTKWRFVKAW